jgi:ADP-ribose pyrophosphatase YjhB (NUDIX family)
MMFDSLAQIPVQERWREQKYPLAIVGAIIRRESPVDNRKADYLLIRRIKDPYQGMWALVGGKWDFGETLAEAIVREVQEETGLETAFVALRGVANERLGTAEMAAGDPAHFLIFVSELQVTAGIAKEQTEGAVAWFSTAELEALRQNGKIIPSDYAMLEQFALAPAVPYVEVEMMVNGNDMPALHRFEEMAG